VVIADGIFVDSFCLNNGVCRVQEKMQVKLRQVAMQGLGYGLHLSRKTPLVVQRKLWLGLLSHGLSEPLQDGDLDCLYNSWLQVKVLDLNISWFFTIEHGALAMQTALPADFENSKHCCVSGGLVDLMCLMNRQQDPDTLFFQRRLMLTGDTELGLEIRNVLDAIDIDELPGKLKRLMQWSTQLTSHVTSH
jgi:predicted lipid carrier protein YhbT